MLQIFVLEREPYWAPELRRQFHDDTSVSVRHLQTAADVHAAAGSSGGVLIGDVSALTRECVEVFRQPMNLFTILLGGPEEMDLENPLREAGADSFFTESVSGEEIGRRIRKAGSLISETC